MALGRPLTKTLACHNCQQWILRSFISAAGGTPALQTGRKSIPQRPFSIAHQRRNKTRVGDQLATHDNEHPLNDINKTFAESSTTTAAESIPQGPPKQPRDDQLPWYLQVQSPIQRTESPLISRQQLPELPDHAPPILHPLLSHLSIELGIDDLILLDLRSLDPPPALGANLLMVVGTARSEKHLHISADRLCRWLRSAYHLSPHADGLLGRNELKLKLKRRAKRSKLLSAVGAKATAQTEIDDGIRTGWVCVNVGRVEGGELRGSEKKMEKIIGVGPSEEGSSVVVQLMTEEKRGEIDLESLWNESLVRAGRRKEHDVLVREEDGGESVMDENGSADMGEEGNIGFDQERSSGSTVHQSVPVSSQWAGQHVRAYHSSARRMHATARTERVYAQDMFLASENPSSKALATTASADKLASMLAELKAMPHRQARRSLGDNPLGASGHLNIEPMPPETQQVEVTVEDTPFLRTFYATMPAYPGSEHWHQHIELLVHARRLGIQEIHSTVLMAQLTNMQIAGLLPEERTFKLVIEAALAPMGTMPEYNGTDNVPTYGKIHNVLTVLEEMESCGYTPVQPEILLTLYRACAGQRQPHTALNLKSVVEQFSLARLRRHARENEWPAFWQSWRSYPQRFLPRTAGMYTVLFSALGAGHLPDLREANDVLRSSLEDMEREQPPVILEENAELAGAVAKALEFVEPRLQSDEGDEAGRPWSDWYARCLNVRDMV